VNAKTVNATSLAQQTVVNVTANVRHVKMVVVTEHEIHKTIRRVYL